ncbi:MAG: hypothetical protein FJX76_19290 [Armatimonadetes bacterium]|nr:hypothetical protein [Armatimonadota bacterium]
MKSTAVWRAMLIVALLFATQAGLMQSATGQVNESPYIKWYRWDDNGGMTSVYGEVHNPGTFDVTAINIVFIATDKNGNKIAEYRKHIEGPILAGSDVQFDFNVPDTGEINQTVLYVNVASE